MLKHRSHRTSGVLALPDQYGERTTLVTAHKILKHGRCISGAPLKPALLYRWRALVRQRHFHTNAQPKFVTTIEVCATFNYRPGKAAVVQRSKFLRLPSVHELSSSSAKLWLSGVLRRWTLPERIIDPLSPLAVFCAAQNVWSVRRDHKRWPSVYGVSLTVANVCVAVTSGDELFLPF